MRSSRVSRRRCSSCWARRGRTSSSKCRRWSSERLEPRVPAARGRHALRRLRGRGRRPGARRGGLQHLHVRLPGGGHRPQLRRPDHRLHLPADRQLRRGGGAHGVRSRPRARRDHARGDRPRGRAARRGRLADLAARLRRSGADRGRHARAGAPHPRQGRDARRRLPRRDCPRPSAAERIRAEPPMAGRDLAREVTPSAAAGLRGRRPAHSCSASTRASRRRSCATCASAACGWSSIPARQAPRSCWRATPTPSSWPTARATRPRSTTSSTTSAGGRQVPVLGICLGHQLLCRAVGLEPTSCRSATAAPTTLSRTSRPADRHHLPEPRLRGARPRRRGQDGDRRAGPLGDRLRRRRAAATSTSTTARSRAWSARRHVRPPVPPRGGPRPARRPSPVRPLPGDDA